MAGADDEWLPDADALATVLALLRRHKLASVEQLLISELECRADAATRAAVDAFSTPAPSDGGGEEGDAPPGPGDLQNTQQCVPLSLRSGVEVAHSKQPLWTTCYARRTLPQSHDDTALSSACVCPVGTPTCLR
jgi:hypothetical protein